MKRWFALIDSRTDQPIRMFWAGPRRPGSAELEQHEMGWPRVILLFDYQDGPMLFRYTATGEFAGDTWHASLDDAKDQAEFEYGQALGRWLQIPDEIAKGTEAEFALRKAGTT